MYEITFNITDYEKASAFYTYVTNMYNIENDNQSGTTWGAEWKYSDNSLGSISMSKGDNGYFMTKGNIGYYFTIKKQFAK